ncbi:PDR/VanB family oxidoreductase [Castellaniella sp.]|jgi:vanillate O-demethylase ferredoxin subunit|uniref:PDR/VanB family oxidoreductase n=1 Tax=Castellaniella sp. TaxID=1955812 RepID=UPI003A8E17F0
MVGPVKHLQLVVRRIDEPVPGVRRLWLADREDWRLPSFRIGAHIDLHLGRHLVRTYSLCNDPQDDRQYVVAVKKEEHSRGGSQYIHETLQAGDVIGVSVPRSGLELSSTLTNVFIAGGIGVTPFISAIRSLERDERENYILYWSSLGPPSLIDMLQPAFSAGRVQLYDTRREDPPHLGSILKQYEDNAKVFCCGPGGMLDAFENLVADWPDDRKHIERFVAPKFVPDANAHRYRVVLAKSGREKEVLPEVGLLATLESMDADIIVSCGGGICGACRTPWSEGPAIHHDRVLTPREREREVCVCVADCSGARLVLDI